MNELSKPPKSEKQAREWFADWYKRGDSKGKPGLTWIEFALGGSPGAPDVLVPVGGKLVACELKVGEFRGSDGALLVKFRPAQINWHSDMAAGGVKTFAFIYTRMGMIAVRGKDVKRFANGECIDWPEVGETSVGEILSFFSMVENDIQHAESIANYRRNVVRIEATMAAGKRNPKGLISKASKSVDKPRSKNARAVTPSTPAVTAKAKAQKPSAVLLKSKGKIPTAAQVLGWPKPNATATKSKPAPKKRAKLAPIVAVVASAKTKASSIRTAPKAKPR